jgi:hypothetical protein
MDLRDGVRSASGRKHAPTLRVVGGRNARRAVADLTHAKRPFLA